MAARSAAATPPGTATSIRSRSSTRTGAYLYVSTDRQCDEAGVCALRPTLSVIPLAADLLHASGPRTPLLTGDGGWELSGATPLVENPSMTRVGSRYYLFYSGGNWRGAYGMGYAVGDSPTAAMQASPFVKAPDNPNLRETDAVRSPGGGMVVRGPSGGDWLTITAVPGHTASRVPSAWTPSSGPRTSASRSLGPPRACNGPLPERRSRALARTAPAVWDQAQTAPTRPAAAARTSSRPPNPTRGPASSSVAGGDPGGMSSSILQGATRIVPTRRAACVVAAANERGRDTNTIVHARLPPPRVHNRRADRVSDLNRSRLRLACGSRGLGMRCRACERAWPPAGPGACSVRTPAPKSTCLAQCGFASIADLTARSTFSTSTPPSSSSSEARSIPSAFQRSAGSRSRSLTIDSIRSR